LLIDAEIRDRRRRQIFGSVTELGDIAFQRMTWLNLQLLNPHFTFVEFFECFYDACDGDYDILDRASEKAPLNYLVRERYVSEAERNAIGPVHIALKDYEYSVDDYDHQFILSDPSWHSVVSVASRSVQKLKEIIIDPRELGHLVIQLPHTAMKKWP
jgi:hypothetical protein